MEIGQIKRDLENFVQSSSENEAAYINDILFRRNRIKVAFSYIFLSRYWLAKGVLAYTRDQNVYELRQCCYLACRLRLASLGHEGGEDFYSLELLFTAMLSDHYGTIRDVATAFIPHGNEPERSQSFMFRLFQLALNDELDALAHHVKLARKKWRRGYQIEIEMLDFFDFFSRGNLQEMQGFVQVKHSRLNYTDPIIENVFGYPAVLETKLCWIKELPIQIDSPLVPMDLMPVRPLIAYDDVYEFLKPGWVPPPQGMLADAARWLKSKFS